MGDKQHCSLRRGAFFNFFFFSCPQILSLRKAEDSLLLKQSGLKLEGFLTSRERKKDFFFVACKRANSLSLKFAFFYRSMPAESLSK